jgi:hypothetical protein
VYLQRRKVNREREQAASRVEEENVRKLPLKYIASHPRKPQSSKENSCANSFSSPSLSFPNSAAKSLCIVLRLLDEERPVLRKY